MKAKIPVYQFKMTLKHSSPVIWRRFTVPSNFTLGDLHAVIQIIMGWEDYHLHQFTINKQVYGMTDDDDDGGGFFLGENAPKREDDFTLDNVISKPKAKMLYTYDFGDDWDHELVLEKILPPETVAPECLGGKLATPVEDCGGMWGYYNLLEALKDPKHPEHEDMMEWIGEEIDPETFPLDQINEVFVKFRKLLRK